MSFEFQNLLNTKYWFAINPGVTAIATKIILAFFIFFFVLGILTKIYLKQLKKQKKIHYLKKIYLDRIADKFWIYAFLGLCWLFFRKEGVFVLSMRFFGLMIIVLAISHLLFLYLKMRKEIPLKLAEIQRKKSQRELKIRHGIIKKK